MKRSREKELVAGDSRFGVLTTLNDWAITEKKAKTKGKCNEEKQYNIELETNERDGRIDRDKTNVFCVSIFRLVFACGPS